ncbi:MAG: N-acetylmuramoyl-L-alanine amidase, partial [Elusimicrobia bacterium]|nr:N-acetylmuramoyl-L-alanine amidase [Elusimicrobiota bacterium]
MYAKTKKTIALFLFLLPGIIIAEVTSGDIPKEEKKITTLAEKKLKTAPWDFSQWKHTGSIILDSIKVQKKIKSINIYFSPQFTHIPVRQNDIKTLKEQIKTKLGKRFSAYSVNIYSKGLPVETFIPNFFRDENLEKDQTRQTIRKTQQPIVTRNYQSRFTGGLTDRHIALWPGHGWYFEQILDRWEWQRARLFQTVEDLYPYYIVTNYLIPMLENSGAYVFLPRERCTQTHEVIVDNDKSTGNSELIINNGSYQWENVKKNGFQKKEILLDGENPFEMGSHLRIKAGGNVPGSLFYTPDIPEDGEYAIYIAWAKSELNIDDVRCNIKYSGGNAEFLLNQKMGSGTWIYLGTYFFNKGKNDEYGLQLSSASNNEGFITADAVRFGGGMGNIARGIDRGNNPLGIHVNDSSEISIINKPTISGRPRFMEGARYFLQYSGMPDSLVYNLNKGKKDYNDDYMSRGEWVNYLMGSPNGPSNYPDTKGLGIPVDLTMSFHTDAGITPNDSIIGTLAIYSTKKNEGLFPEGKSRLASRDLSDIIQTQIVEDIRCKYNEKWTRRGLWDREYSEAWRPNTPAMLLELLSHQNAADMRFGLDPRFQFDVSRAIYKGITRFINGSGAIVQPLPPSFMQIEYIDNKKIRISWQPTTDTLETTASPEFYKVYCQSPDKGFDTGTITSNNYLEWELDEWSEMYNFRVTALNAGGESFPGETLSVALLPNQKPDILIVNGFDRISGPSWFNNGEKNGIDCREDEGVPYGTDFSKVGNQYNFNRDEKWLDDDNPGWGSSNADTEGTAIPGNNFSYPSIHGKAFLNANRSFISISNESFEKMHEQNIKQFNVIDLIFGEQKGTPDFKKTDRIDFRVFSNGIMQKLEYFALNKGNILLSGAYIGTDMIENNDSAAIKFTK